MDDHRCRAAPPAGDRRAAPCTDRGGAAGFTLLEVMVAVAVAGLTLVALLQLVSGASESSVRARAHTRAMALAEGKMERLMSAPPSALMAADGRSGSFEEPFERFRYEVSVRRLPDPQLAEIDLRVRWEANRGGLVRLTTRALLLGSAVER